MAKTEEKPKKKKPARPKKGLHGWKAALTVFGCGTLAAFGVFGVIIGLLGTLLNATSSGIEAKEDASQSVPEMVGDPQESIDPGDLDICNRNLESASNVQLTRVGKEDNYEDTYESDERVVSDSCSWELTSEFDGTDKWDFTYTYDAYIETLGEDRIDVASVDFDERVNQLGRVLASVESEGESDLADRSYYVYGETDSGRTGYVLMAKTRSAIYEIYIEAGQGANSGDLVPENPIYREVSKIVRLSEIEFELWIPGTD